MPARRFPPPWSSIICLARQMATSSTKVALLGLALFWNTGLLAANDDDMTTEYLTCVRNSEGVTSKILDCISAELNRQDSRLNDAYKKLMSKIPKDRKRVAN
jgi:uncharacterized protein YecT (DUF1311 family)